MVSGKVIIKNPTGLHLRAAGVFCKTAMLFDCKIMLEKVTRRGEISANAKSVLSVLGASVKCGDEITIVCDGKEEEKALQEMISIVEDGLGE
jgi:phosphocarrier protein